MNYAIIKGMEIQPEDRPQTVQEWLTLLQLQPQSIMSQMSQVSQTIMSQMSTLNIPSVKPISQKYISQNYVKNSYTGEPNGLFMGIGVFIFVIVIYIFAPNFDFSTQETKIKEIDYTALENFFKSDNFQEADKETLRILLLLVEREKQYWLDLEDLENIPCKDLDKINKLWINYSNGKFGFRIQKQIWIELGGKLEIYDVVIADIFIKEVGWGEKNKRYKNIKYKISAPYGHLPFRATTHVHNFGVSYIAKKLEKCESDNS